MFALLVVCFVVLIASRMEVTSDLGDDLIDFLSKELVASEQVKKVFGIDEMYILYYYCVCVYVWIVSVYIYIYIYI